MEGADPRDEEDHLRPIGALPASDRKTAPGESSEGPFLESHGSTNRRRGINIPHPDWERSSLAISDVETYL